MLSPEQILNGCYDSEADALRVSGGGGGGGGSDATAANQLDTNTKLDTLHADAATLAGYVDGIESKLDTIHTDLATTLAGYTDGLEGKLDTLHTDLGTTIHADLTSANTKLDTLQTGKALDATLGTAGTSPPTLPNSSTGLMGFLRLIYATILAALGTAGSAGTSVVSVQGIASMTAVKVDGSAVTQPISGTVTANAGTNLNTSALALETGGNLATAATALGTTGTSPPTLPSSSTGIMGYLRLLYATILAALGTAGTAGTSVVSVQGIASGVAQPISGSVGVSGTVGVSSLPALVAGTALVGKVGIDQTTPGTTNGVQLNAALPAGANAIGKLAANSGVIIGALDVATSKNSAISLGSNIASTGLDSKTTTTLCGPFALDNTSSRLDSLVAELVLGSFTPGTGGYVTLILVASADGTNYEDTAAGRRETITLLPGASAKRCVFGNATRLPLLPLKYNIWIDLEPGATTAATGNTLRLGTYGLEA